MTALHFLLNGEPRAETSAPPTMTVLDWLRTVARLTGTKEGCAEGDCGACTIVLARPENGALRYEAVNSCLMMLPQLEGCAVLTVEGLAAPERALHPVQQALVDTDATQCGFCTPGFVMAMFAFRQGGEPADDAHIHEALAGNLCRCTGYRSIVDACRRIAGEASARLADEASTIDALRALPACTEYHSGDQALLAPRSLDDLLDAVARYPDAIVLGGGTDLGLRVSKDREALPRVISTAAVHELQAGQRNVRRFGDRRRRDLHAGVCPISTGIFPRSARSSAASARGRSAISARSPAISPPPRRSATPCPA